MQIHCKACGRLYDAPQSIDGPGCPACTHAMVSPRPPLAIVHHASWHLLRAHKGRARIRNQTAVGKSLQKGELCLAKALQAATQSRLIYAAIQGVELKQVV